MEEEGADEDGQEERPKDANDALRKGMCFKKIMTENARWLDQQKILSMASLSHKIQHRIMNKDQLQGIRS